MEVKSRLLARKHQSHRQGAKMVIFTEGLYGRSPRKGEVRRL